MAPHALLWVVSVLAPLLLAAADPRSSGPCQLLDNSGLVLSETTAATSCEQCQLDCLASSACSVMLFGTGVAQSRLSLPSLRCSGRPAASSAPALCVLQAWNGSLLAASQATCSECEAACSARHDCAFRVWDTQLLSRTTACQGACGRGISRK